MDISDGEQEGADLGFYLSTSIDERDLIEHNKQVNNSKSKSFNVSPRSRYQNESSQVCKSTFQHSKSQAPGRYFDIIQEQKEEPYLAADKESKSSLKHASKKLHPIKNPPSQSVPKLRQTQTRLRPVCTNNSNLSKYEAILSTGKKVQSGIDTFIDLSSDRDEDLNVADPVTTIETVNLLNSSDSGDEMSIKEFSSTKSKSLNQNHYALDFGSDTDSCPDVPVSVPPVKLFMRIKGSSPIKKQGVARKSIEGTVKSKVIYTESPLLRTMDKTCKRWTEEMSMLYDNDVPGYFDISDVYALQSDNPEKWKIENSDKFNKSYQYTHHKIRCLRCKEFGHLANKCTKVSRCQFCGETNHTSKKCPRNCCFQCGEKSHNTCHNIVPKAPCNVCRSTSHRSHACPDLWRRFHNTTQGVQPVKGKCKKPMSKAWCSNCARNGHYGFECKQKPFRCIYQEYTRSVYSYKSVGHTGKDNDHMSRFLCTRCQKVGHRVKDCPKNKKSLKKKKLAGEKRRKVTKVESPTENEQSNSLRQLSENGFLRNDLSIETPPSRKEVSFMKKRKIRSLYKEKNANIREIKGLLKTALNEGQIGESQASDLVKLLKQTGEEGSSTGDLNIGYIPALGPKSHKRKTQKQKKRAKRLGRAQFRDQIPTVFL